MIRNSQNKERKENALNASCRLVNNCEVFPFGDQWFSDVG